MKVAYCVAAAVAIWASSASADVLDGLVFGVKCIGAADPATCEQRAQREADETRQRLQRQSGPAGDPAQTRTATAGDAPFGKKIYRNWVENVICREFTKRSRRDVDSTYARAISHYGFMTPSQVQHQPLATESGLQIAGYLHEATPGALYRLEQVVHSPDVASGKRQYKLMLELARDGPGTQVKARYCVTTDDPRGWRDLLPQVHVSLSNVL